MAVALLPSLVEVILENLSSLAVQEFGLAWGLKKELEKLESTLSTIQAVIQDAEEKQTKNEPLRIWLRKLKDAAYDADDILDEFATEALRQRAGRHDFMQNKVRNFFSPRNPFKFRFNMGHKIKDIVERLDAIAGERSKFHLREGVTEYRRHDDGERRHTSSFVTESEIFGRDEDKEKIIELLLTNVSRQEDVSICAIVGMGGLGKTTLAQLVYNEERVERHFELRIWVCVSEDFDIKRLTKAIIESAGGTVCDISELDPIQRRLQERLSGKRFLLVLDDVWNEDQEMWDRLKHVVRCGAKGSTIIVTTRSEKVASIMATLPTHHLRGLSEDDCWSLFKERAFGSGRREESPNLVAIGKEIVKKCGCVPLAVKALGGLMHFKSEESEWLIVKESELWDLSDAEILPALRLSYNHLPSHLRQCFSFCSIFPKDHIIKKDELIQLWMANGFILSKGRMDLDDMGHEIFNDLVWRSFFQDINRDAYGSISNCKMHDLMHDLAQSITGNECFIMEPGEAQKIPGRRVRHLSCNVKNSLCTSPFKEDLHKPKSLRTLLLIFNYCSNKMEFVPYISKLRFLRVLCLSCNKKIPMSMGNLKHLRYLDLSWSDFDQLPESMSSLYNLQTLKLKNCRRLRKLPKDMRDMSNLRYLDLIGCNSLTHMPKRMGELNSLQTLTRFIVGKENGRHIRELQGLKLKGDVSIENLGEVRNLAEAKDANLGGKHNLQSLSLSWRKNDNVGLQANVDEVLEGLQPHTNLKTLSIKGYHGSKFPNWMRDLFISNLVKIKLENCDRCEDLSPLGRLRLLKFLSINGMDVIKYFDSDVDGDDTVKAFPSLEQLTICSMPSLEEWTRREGKEIFPCLRELRISNCPKLITLPCLNSTSLTSLRISDFPEIMPSLEEWTRREGREIFPCLTELQISNCPKLITLLWLNFTSLTSLHISNFPEIMSLPDGLLDNLVSLTDLTLDNCDELACLPEGLRNLTSLNSLRISYCNSLMSLPEEGLRGLSSLRTLSIQMCKKLVSLSEGVRHLTALKDLLINRCPELTSLPEGMQHLVSLKSLKIWHCKGLFSLPEWLGNLTSLSYLDIRCCDNIRTLPEGLQHATTLKELRIEACPHLERRCKKESGEDWHKIAHIPKIHIIKDRFSK